MRGRTIIQHLPSRPYAPFFITTLVSVVILSCWLITKPFSLRDSATSAALVDEDETDAALQRAALEALGQREGTIIVMNPQSGRVRAVVNSPLAFEQAFSPGSTVKPFTVLAAMRAGLINERSRLLCREHYASADFEISCSHPKINAPFQPAQALAYSCNYYFGKLGERLNEDAFDATLSSFGFGSRTSALDEREATGRLPRDVRWRSNLALGESKELLVTPMQLITAYSALVNGGHLYAPQVAPARGFNKSERSSLTLAPAHRALLIEGMRGAIVYGTAEHAALSRLPLYVFGKTGTATASDNLHTQGWFVGFASAQNQTQDVPPESVELAVLVFLKQAHGAECAEISRPIFEAFIRQRGERETVKRETVKRETVTLESLKSLTTMPSPVSSTPASLSVPQSVRVHLAREGKTVSLSFEDYVQGVLAAEGAIEEQPEALKALAVTVRTYALQNLNRHAQDGYDFCNTTHCQRYVFEAGNAKTANSELIRRALVETAGEVLLDRDGRAADAFFHAACGGMTANVATLWGSVAPEYLRGVKDEYCVAMPHRDWTDVIPAARLAEALRSDSRTDVGAHLKNVILSKRDLTGRAELITLEGERRRVVRGWDFKIIVGRSLGWNVLKSSRFDVSRAGANFVFRGSGFGHGVGLCQEGAHVMARRGASYRQILNYYFPGASVGLQTLERKDAETKRRDESSSGWKADVLTRELEPRRSTRQALAFNSSAHRSNIRATQNRQLSLTSEHFRLSYPPGVEQREAENVLRTLEAARAELSRRVAAASLSFDESRSLDVILHATTGDFVSATGQPQWAAGATKERRIELQPLAVLRRRGVLATTLRHEYAHAVIDALSGGRAPRWLSEGLAIYLAGEGARLARFETKAALSTSEIEERLARPASAEEMRSLYVAAYRQVQALVRAAGERNVWRRVAQKE